MSPAKWLLVSFLTLILIGSGLLMLPGTTTHAIGYIDALFTSTTAVCVTGLMVLDIQRDFTPLGQAVILGLIQCGGLGIVTLACFLIVSVGRKFSLSHEEMLSHTVAVAPDVGFRPIVFAVIKFTLVVEGIGALAWFLLWPGEETAGETLWQSVFHAVSAFCNAGIGLRSTSLEAFRESPGVILTIALLIILGGFGFTNFLEIQNRVRAGEFRWSRFSLFLKISLVMTLLLNAVGFFVLLLLESDIAFRDLAFVDMLVNAFFHAVTTRTAGFNTIPLAEFSDLSLSFMSLYMWIGGVSGSTAGGIKVTTAAVLFAVFRAYLRNHSTPVLFNRRNPLVDQRKAVVLLVVSLFAIAIGVLLLSLSEDRLIAHAHSPDHMVEIYFEVLSALGTVGLSTGITPDLTLGGKAVVIVMMIVGRLGPLVIIAMWVSRPKPQASTDPEEAIAIG